MGSPWPENSPDLRKAAIEEILQGHRFAKELKQELAKPEGNLTYAKELAMKIYGSHTKTLSILTSGEAGGQVLPDMDGQKFEDSGESCRSSSLKNRRGSYKRRKNAQSWTKVCATPIEDGHAWRKYGQKVILNAKHPRNYFRCTHKPDQNCRATKQVQQTEDDPPMYSITYNGHHTCRSPLKSPQFIVDSAPRDYSSITWSFGSNSNNNPEETVHYTSNSNPFISLASSPLVIKQEYNQSLSTDYLLSPELFESSEPMMANVPGSDHGGDVISCTASSHADLPNIDFVVDSVFDDVLSFEF